MGKTIYPTVPVAQPEAEPWPVDGHAIRVDEMFARQLDNEFSAGVRGLLHDPETGIAAQSGEAALEAIAGALPALNDLKERMLAQAIGPRQRSILEPLIETRLDWAAGTLGQLAQRATVEVDDQSVTDKSFVDARISTKGSIQAAMASGRLSPEAGAKALENADNGNMAIVTAGTGSARNGVVEQIVGGERAIVHPERRP